jgi:pyruvate/2-oxoglutarate dehydrogenase complex dihydrolipoamide dehydrogenase (E3) component
MSSLEKYDAIVIGAGQAGVPLSTDLAGAGRRTLLIERAHVGGTCVNEGCTPTKTMVASARVAYLARRGRDYGVETGDVRVDMARVRERKRTIVESFRSGSERRLAGARGLDLVSGEARFTGPRAIVVARSILAPSGTMPTWRGTIQVAT